MENRTVHLSASSIAAFKMCPTKFRLAYLEGLRPAEDTESQRRGTNWHKMHEVYANALVEWKDVDPSVFTPFPEAPEFALDAVIRHLNERYAECPASIPVEKWALERQQLLTCFVGYLWYFKEDPVEFLASEVPFELPVYMPRSGMKLPIKEVVRVGKIDHIVKWHDSICALERKSTTRSIADDGDYWERCRKDTQVSMYALAFREMYAAGAFEQNVILAACFAGKPRFGNTLYDAWHVPTIKPAMLTQKDTAAFIETGEYFGQKFKVHHWPPVEGSIENTDNCVHVDEVACAVEPGKKGFAIHETIEMYGARLLADIQERPTFYFARREISRTDQELKDFQKQLVAVYEAMRAFEKTGCWFENESQCRATFPCPNIAICYGPGADAVCDGKTTPAGYKRIFVNPVDNAPEME